MPGEPEGQLRASVGDTPLERTRVPPVKPADRELGLARNLRIGYHAVMGAENDNWVLRSLLTRASKALRGVPITL
jgi:hypothetical protein